MRVPVASIFVLGIGSGIAALACAEATPGSPLAINQGTATGTAPMGGGGMAPTVVAGAGTAPTTVPPTAVASGAGAAATPTGAATGTATGVVVGAAGAAATPTGVVGMAGAAATGTTTGVATGTTTGVTTTGTTGTTTGTTTGVITSTGTTTGTTTGTATGGGAMTGNADFPLVVAAYAYDDGSSTATISITEGSVCLSGTAVDTTADYTYWGAGIGLQLAEGEGTLTPFNADAEGITSVAFTVSGNVGFALRVGVNTVSLETGAIRSGSAEGDITSTGNFTVAFADLAIPEWESTGAGDPLDTTDINSVQFQTVSENGADNAYDFCIENVTFQ